LEYSAQGLPELAKDLPNQFHRRVRPPPLPHLLPIVLLMDLPIAANALAYEEPKAHRRHDLLDLLGRGGFGESVATRARTTGPAPLLLPSREGTCMRIQGVSRSSWLALVLLVIVLPRAPCRVVDFAPCRYPLPRHCRRSLRGSVVRSWEIERECQANPSRRADRAGLSVFGTVTCHRAAFSSYPDSTQSQFQL